MRRSRLAKKQPKKTDLTPLFKIKNEEKHIPNLKGKWKEYLGPMNKGKITDVRERDKEKFDSIKNAVHAEINRELAKKGYFFEGEDPDCDPTFLIIGASAKAALLLALGKYTELIDDLVAAIETFAQQFDIITIAENLIECVETTLEELFAGLIGRIIFSYLIVVFVVGAIALIALYFSEAITASTLAISIVGLIIVLILFGALTGLLILVFVEFERDVLINCFITARDALIENYACALTAALIEFIVV